MCNKTEVQSFVKIQARLILLFIVFIFVFGCSTLQKTTIYDQNNSEVKKVRLEFRFAEHFPDTGLIQKTVKGSFQIVYLKDEILFSNSDVENAYIVKEYNHPTIGLTFNKKSSEKFYDVTRNNINKSIAILLDGVVISVNQIREAIPNGKSIIVGTFTEKEAKDIISGILNY